MNVTVEPLAPCKKLLRVELDVKSVDEAFETVTRNFQKEAALPGFRPGKAPKDMVLKKYGAEIRDEARRTLIGNHYREALKQNNIDPVSQPDIEEIQFEKGQNLIFSATVETRPEFELPQYKGLPAKLEAKQVTDADVNNAIDLLRGRHATYQAVDRELRLGDVAVIQYSGRSEGQPLTQFAPTAKGLTEQTGFWLELKPGEFIPGFCEQLVGARAGDKRVVQVEFPADFVSKDLQGRKAEYDVQVTEAKEKVLPEVNDEFAGKYGAANVEKITIAVRESLENELKFSKSRSVRQQVVQQLLQTLNFDIPESVLAQETRNLVYDLVHQNTKRGVSKELIETQKDEIFAAASANARERVRLAFVVQRIAENEKIQVEQEDIVRQVRMVAAMNSIPEAEILKDLNRNQNGLNDMIRQALHEKTLRFLEQNAVVTETPPAA